MSCFLGHTFFSVFNRTKMTQVSDRHYSAILFSCKLPQSFFCFCFLFSTSQPLSAFLNLKLSGQTVVCFVSLNCTFLTLQPFLTEKNKFEETEKGKPQEKEGEDPEQSPEMNPIANSTSGANMALFSNALAAYNYISGRTSCNIKNAYCFKSSGSRTMEYVPMPETCAHQFFGIDKIPHFPYFNLPGLKGGQMWARGMRI